jgi:hypothetical protein
MDDDNSIKQTAQTAHTVTKPQQERLSEGIQILQHLKDLGVPDTLPSYILVKSHINEWIRNGNLFEDKIPFPTFDRTATIYLPSDIGKTATLAFKLNNPDARLAGKKRKFY